MEKHGDEYYTVKNARDITENSHLEHWLLVSSTISVVKLTPLLMDKEHRHINPGVSPHIWIPSL